LAINDIDKEIENNSDMDNKSVMLRTESNKSQETSLAVQNHGKSSKTAILDFSKAEDVIHFNSDYCVIEQHILAEKSLSIEERPTVGEHDNGGKEGTLACQPKVISSSSGKTGLTGSWRIRLWAAIKRRSTISSISKFHAFPIYSMRYALQVIYPIPNQIVWFQSIHLLVT
jgi:hypothetical protein